MSEPLLLTWTNNPILMLRALAFDAFPGAEPRDEAWIQRMAAIADEEIKFGSAGRGAASTTVRPQARRSPIGNSAEDTNQSTNTPDNPSAAPLHETGTYACLSGALAGSHTPADTPGSGAAVPSIRDRP